MLIGASVALQLSAVASPRAAEDKFADFPFVISCEYKGMFHAFYLSRITPDGLATYVASERLAGTISLDGHAKAVGGSNGGNCLGKTLDQLRASGQAHFLQP
ncbi:hypothetical protein [Rhizobium sp. Root1220]|uniref:hypothetical protein n=1 Tax=Rhizobium sp. Root1220 TaxID=1736432 RepID=UPI001FCDBA58|nr:hypothetical protein [Rhizobium sp. Root1220]